MSSLYNKTVSGFFWSFLQNIGARGISFAVMILLARLLTPTDFGLVGMLTFFIGVSQALVDGGFNAALIQKKNIDEGDYSSVFYINLIVGILLYLTLFLISPFIAIFYNQPLLILLTRTLCLVFIINAFSYVQEARLRKELRFKTLMLINIPSTIIGGAIGIIMASYGYGVWSIIALQLSTRLLYAIQIWIYTKWSPLLLFDIDKAKTLFSFGSKLMISGVITNIYTNIYLVIIGKFFSVTDLGYYQNSSNLVYTPSSTLTNVLSGVTFPVFSSIQDDNDRLKMGYRRAMQQVFLFACPAYVLAGVLATPLFLLVFSSKWLPAVPYFQCLCIVGIFNPLEMYNLNIVNVKGRSDVWLKLQLIRRVATIIAVLFVIPYGIMPLLILQALSSVLTFLFFSHYAGKFIQFSLKEQVRSVLPIFLLSLVTGIIILFMNETLSHYSSIVHLSVGFSIGIGLYILLANMLKLSSYLDFIYIFKTKFLNRVVA